MRFKKTRIAVSAACGVLCVLLIGLWIRSYWWHDLIAIQYVPSCLISSSSETGILYFGISRPAPGFPKVMYQRLYLGPRFEEGIEPDGTTFGFYFSRSVWNGGVLVLIPHYFAVLLLALAAVLPGWRWITQGIRRIPHQFSVRTMPIFTTLVALVLGAVVYFAKT